MSEKVPSLAYARAVFETAEKENVLDEVYQDFVAQEKLLKDSPDLAAFLRARSLDEVRVQTLEKIFASRIHPLTLKFLKFLARKNRLEIFPEIIPDFVDLYRKKRNIAALEVTSFSDLDEATLANIRQRWSQRLGQSVDINLKTDRAILGGVVFKIGDHVRDYSIKTQLNKLREELMK